MPGFLEDFIIYVDGIFSGEQGSGILLSNKKNWVIPGGIAMRIQILPVALRFSQNLNETIPKVYFQ
jgi:hypothetical protein